MRGSSLQFREKAISLVFSWEAITLGVALVLDGSWRRRPKGVARTDAVMMKALKLTSWVTQSVMLLSWKLERHSHLYFLVGL